MPLGKYPDWSSCIAAQKKMGKDDLSARKICGTIEKKTQEGLQKQAAANVKYEQNDHLYVKAFLLDASTNINQWGVNPNSLDRQINSFIGKPLVLTEDFHHPLPPELQRVGAQDSEYYDDDDDPYNTVNVNDIVEHWLAFQEPYRIGNIIDITEKKGTYFAIIEITDPAAKEAFRNNDVPLFVSPAIAQLDPHEDATNISNWTGIHLAIVSDPAYTIKKALVTSQCHGDSEKCLLQLRQAAVQRQEIPRIGCGFCRTKALARYAEIVKHWTTNHWTQVKSPNDLYNVTNSSIDFSKANSKIELTDQDNQQNTTADTNKPQEFEKKQQQQGGDLGEQTQKGLDTGEGNLNKEVTKQTKTETTTTTQEEVNKTAEEIGLKVAGMQECIQIFQQNGVDPQQAGQICKLAAQALMENQQQQPPAGGGQQQGAPKNPGQFGSVADYEKEIAKQEMKIAQLSEELKNYKKGDKTDAQRIAELEETVTTLSRNLKEKELEAYLVTKIADEDLRSKKIKRFAELNMTIDDLKDIYENVNSKTATNSNVKPKTAEVNQQLSPISKVKLQVASTNDSETAQDTKISNEIRERNNKILSSLLQKGGIY